jgi:hypothetical protein
MLGSLASLLATQLGLSDERSGSCRHARASGAHCAAKRDRQKQRCKPAGELPRSKRGSPARPEAI